MLADSEPQDRCDHSPNWVIVGKAKQGGGVKQVHTPLPWGEGRTGIFLLDAEYSHPQEEGPSLPEEGGFIPSIEDGEKLELTKNTKPIAKARGHACQKIGGWCDNPQGITWVTRLNSPQIITPTIFELQ